MYTNILKTSILAFTIIFSSHCMEHQEDLPFKNGQKLIDILYDKILHDKKLTELDQDNIKLLIDAGADVNVRDIATNATALIIATMDGYIGIVRLLIDEDANLNLQTNLGHTALMIGAINGYIEVVKLLIDKGADLNLQDNNGNTALMTAAFKGYTEIVRLLIDNGADLNLKNRFGETALMWAVKYGHTKIVKLLKSKGALG